MNGCLIIGTWDGANIEIAEETGVDNVFVFGVRADEINQLRKVRSPLQPTKHPINYGADWNGKPLNPVVVAERYCLFLAAPLPNYCPPVSRLCPYYWSVA